MSSQTLSNGSNGKESKTITSGPALPCDAFAICGVGVRWPGGVRTSGDFGNWIHSQGRLNGSESTNGNGAKDTNGHVDEDKLRNRYHDGGRPNGSSDEGSDPHHEGFDAAFFSISDAEAALWSLPQKRALETVHECLEDAGEVCQSDRDALVGCFVAVDHLDGALEHSNGNGDGSGMNDIASHLSMIFGFEGPCSMITGGDADALQQGCEAIAEGKAHAIIIVSIDSAGAASAVHIKKADQAIQDGNPIRTVIRRSYLTEGMNDQNGSISTTNRNGAHANGPGTLVNGLHIHLTGTNCGRLAEPLSVMALVKSVFILERGTTVLDKNETFNGVPSQSNSNAHMKDAFTSLQIREMSITTSLDAYLPPTPKRSSAFATQPELLLFSARTQASLHSQINSVEKHVQQSLVSGCDVAYTLAMRRKHFDHRGFSILQQGKLTSTSASKMSSDQGHPITMVFTGQGSQWTGMGMRLMEVSQSFKEDIEKMDAVLQELRTPPKWSLREQLSKQLDDPESLVNSAELGPALTTALQIAIFNQIQRLDVQPSVAVGHSTGEIAAAYAAGYLSLEKAMTIAYYYGYTTRDCRDGAMAAVPLGVDDVQQFLRDGVVVACENSPSSTTLSGDRTILGEVLDRVKSSRPGIDPKLLHVEVAYHSQHTHLVADEFLRCLNQESLSARERLPMTKTLFVSSLYGTTNSDVSPSQLRYWARNLTSPVKFSSAVLSLLENVSKDTLFVEIGPHSALAAPLKQICAAAKTQYRYVSTQKREKDSYEVFLTAVGRLWQASVVHNLGSLYSHGRAVAGLPPYSWDHGHIAHRLTDYRSARGLDLSPSEKREQALLSNTNRDTSRLDTDDVPKTDMELVLRYIWVQVLNGVLDVSLDHIGRKSNFFLCGGDSIASIELSSLAFEYGIRLGASDITQNPELAQMAAVASYEDDELDQDTEPFSLVPSTELSSVIERIQNQCSLSLTQTIEDLYPCTALQEGFMALGMKQPGSYIGKHVFKLPKNVDINRFKQSWEQTVQLCSALRTRIIVEDEEALQVLTKGDVDWDTDYDGMSISEALAKMQNIFMSYGTALNRFALFRGADGHVYFSWITHHAVLDEWTMRLILNTFQNIYRNVELKPLGHYARFIKYVSQIDQDKAVEYWSQALKGASQATFPPPASLSQGKSGTTRVIKKVIGVPDVKGSSITRATVMRAAWAMVLARYSDTNDVCFGTTVSGRQAPVPGLLEMTGPVVATVPIRVRIDKQQSIQQYLQRIQNQASAMVDYEQFGLQSIEKVHADAKEACKFTSLLVIQPIAHLTPGEVGSTENLLTPIEVQSSDGESANLQNYFSYPLVTQCHLFDQHVELVFVYDSGILEAQIEGLINHFETVVQQLNKQNDTLLGQVYLSGQWDLVKALEWKGEDPELLDGCFHDIIERNARESPSAPAIAAWDQSFTYGELNEAVNRLSNYLVNDLGVRMNEYIHVMFEKSAWYFVAILAINKAGATWVPLDPSHPVERLKQVIGQTGARLCLSSEENIFLSIDIFAETLVVSPKLDEKLGQHGYESMHGPVKHVSSNTAAYVLFTSGSTGVPKGLIMEHRSLCTSQSMVCKRLGLTSDVRMLQFAAFVFDFSIGEIGATLIAGACLCIPSEQDRMDNLAGFIEKMQVSWAFLTPSFARTLNPADVPSLKLLLLGGEAVDRDIFLTWYGKTRFINGWGPAETCCFGSMHEWKSPDESPMTIGAPIGGYCWIVEPDNPQQLAPIGCVGEVVIQSPTLLRDYLSDPTKTGAVIVSDLPAWAPRRSEPRWNRLYKTGDLCYYNAKGQIVFASRKDTQVKIRGLRVELSEVEHRLYKSLEGAKQAAVDLVHTDSGPKLACFFCDKLDTRINPDARASEIFKPLSGDVQAHITAAAGKLNVTLPRYMVPTLYIPCRYMPSITSTKIDRKKLRLLVATLDAEQLLNYSLHDASQRAPETEMEVELQTIWSKLLSLKQEAIGRDDSFLHLGGDSIKAIQLIKVAREHGISLTVRDVFDDPRLCAVASAASLLDVDETHQEAVPGPFSLLSDDVNEATLMKALKTQYGLSGQVELEDAFPCTKLQEGLITIAEKQPGSYIAKNIYRLPQNMDIARFMAAWETTVKLCANLRTRIIRVDGAAIQIIVKEDCQWEAVSDLSSYKASTKDALMGYGSRLSRYAITKERDGSRLFVFDCHHSIFDGWTLPLIVGTLTSAYQGVALPRLHSYSSFVKYVTDLDHHAASSYWSAYLAESSKATFPPSRDSVQPSSGTSTTESRTKVFQRTIHIPSSASGSASVTKASLLRGAWGLVLARYCDLDDVCFGATVSGRQANISGIDEMPGLVIATVPVRVRLNQQQSVEKYLRGIQSDASKMVAYEQFGLQNISKVSHAAKEACNFNSLLVIQPVGHITSTASEGDAVLLQPGPEHAHAEELVQGYFSYSLVVQCHLLEDSIRLAFIYDTEVLPTHRLEALSHHVDHVIQQLTTNTSAKLGSISASSPWDMERFVAANSKVNDVVEDCVHRLFEAQVKQRPDAMAITGWDRSFTYDELNQAADRLAHHLLKNHNVQVGDFIPVCFDKSAWYTVAILAVNKAGGAWVPLDPSHPSQRHQQIVDKVKPRLMLASTSTTELCRKVLPDVISVDEALNMRLASDQELRVTAAPAVKVTPRTAAYVLLTSGSTGVPKALVMEHSAVCTSQVAIYERLNLSPATRMLQFSAHVFHVSVGEIFATLLSGGVVCVPSDDTKLNDLSSFIGKMDVNSAVFTPSFVHTLNPDHIPELDILIVVGEAVSRDVLEKWFGRAKHFINAWGPAEDCVFSSLHEWTSIDESPLTIGHPIGSYGWIVDPKDPSRLAPTGALGEIVLQGPTLLREYLNDAEQTEKSIMTSLPEWAPRGQEAYWDRLYKTGDLGRYNPDGTIEFVSRKDTQIKIRGLRVELGEVEYHVQAAATTARQVVVDVHESHAGSSLIAYLCFSDARELSSQESLPNPFLPLEKERREQLSTAMSDVASKLPRYMIPSRFIPCSYMPVVSSAKVDRKALRWLTAELDDATLTEYSLSDGPKRAPSTPYERKLQGVWAQTLSRDPGSIYRDDSFFDLGGDSIMAIQAVSFARDAGILIRVQDIFHDPRLCAVAERATAIDAGETNESDVKPFSLLSDELQVLARGSEVKSQCGLSSDLTIEDAFPCTSFQEGLLTLSVKQPGSYIAKYIYRLPDNVSLSRFQTAWQETVMACSNLRTRIVLLNNTSVQVVIKDDVHWELANQSTSLKAAMQAMGTKKMTYGSRLCRYSLVSDASGSKYFIWAIHHSVFDGWTVRLIMTALHQAYAGQAVTHLERYSGFIQYLQHVDQAAAGNYWTNQLQNAKRARFPPPLKSAVTNRKPAETKEATRNVIATIDVPSTTNPAITKATFVRAAWAIVLSRYCNSTDVCFGTSISGRQAPVRGILEMPGPAIATVPVRIRLDRNQAALEYLQSVQTQASEMVPYEQFGLQNISKLGADAKDACDFTSLLVIQPRQHLDQVGGSDGSSNGAAPPLLTLVDEGNGDAPGQMLDNYYSYPLIVQGHLGSDSMTLTFTYNIKVLSESTMKAVSEQLSHVIKHLIIKAGNQDEP